jgi:hypothetical protein
MSSLCSLGHATIPFTFLSSNLSSSCQSADDNLRMKLQNSKALLEHDHIIGFIINKEALHRHMHDELLGAQALVTA